MSMVNLLANTLIDMAYKSVFSNNVSVISFVNGVYVLGGSVTGEQADAIGKAWCDAVMAYFTS